MHAQLRELLTGYGEVATLWDDWFWPHPGEAWGSLELEAMARELQPGILVNDHSGISGDFSTPEQSISVLPPFGRWEACMTTNDTRVWHATDDHWKSPTQIVRALAVCAIRLGFLDSRVTGARLLAGGETLGDDQRHDVLTVSGLSSAAPDGRDTVIEIDVDSGPAALPGSYVVWAGEACY